MWATVGKRASFLIPLPSIGSGPGPYFPCTPPSCLPLLGLTWYLHLPCAFSAFAVHANNKQINLHICLHFGFPFSLSRSLSMVSLAISLSCVFCSDLCSVLGLPYCLLALSPSTDWVQFFSACRLGVSSKVDYPGQLWRWRWRRNDNGNGKIHLRVKIQFRFPFCK